MGDYGGDIGVPRYIRGSRSRWQRILSGATSTTALAARACTATLGAASTASSGMISTDGFTGVRFMFGGTDAADENTTYQVTLWYVHERTTTENIFVPIIVAAGNAQLGALTYAVAGAMGPAANLIADTITETLGYGGTKLRAHAADAIAFLEVATQNAAFIEVEIDKNAGGNEAATIDVHMQRGEWGSGGFGDDAVDLLTTIDADTSNLATYSGAVTGAGITFSRISLITAGAATTQLLAKTGSQTQRLHGLAVTVSAGALVEIEDKDAGVLATWNLGANGGIVIPFNRDPEAAIQQTVVNKGLQIVNSAGNLGGYAWVSTSAV
ncbi:hypothetical protein LCGC14_0298340 [marine sediment metagenome]|uniref:Uncharacterized protein n=1 Tax=marine sediment metagenome TaxID=412755 RepID=A0A0F9TW82_9ZZZZ